MRYAFAGFTLDISRRELTKDDETIPVEPKAFDLLHLLLLNAGTVVSRDQLVEVVWNGRIVSEAAISARIAARNTCGLSSISTASIIGST